MSGPVVSAPSPLHWPLALASAAHHTCGFPSKLGHGQDLYIGSHENLHEHWLLVTILDGGDVIVFLILDICTQCLQRPSWHGTSALQSRTRYVAGPCCLVDVTTCPSFMYRYYLITLGAAGVEVRVNYPVCTMSLASNPIIIVAHGLS